MSKRSDLRRWTGILGGLLAGCAATSFGLPGVVLATPSSGFTSTTFAASGVPEFALKTLSPTVSSCDPQNDRPSDCSHQVRISTKGRSDIYITTNVVTPGGTSGWHTHPGPSVVIVKTGTATIYDGDDPTCTPQVYEAGSAFFDPGGGHLHLVRNENSVNLETVAFQIVPAAAGRRIDADSPNLCGLL